MLLTLRQILDLPILAAGLPQVVAGAERLDRPVRWVHVSDVAEVTDLLAGGELILSTGLPLQRGSEVAATYVDELAAAGAAGLVVELGHLLPRLPPQAVAVARRHGLPLVTLDRRVRFVQVTEQVHRAIVSDQVAQLEFAREVHETFTRLSLEDADTAAIVQTAARLCGASVVLEDLARTPVAYAANGQPAAQLLDRWERRSRSTPWLTETGLSGPEGWLTTPVGGRDRTWARLTLPDPGADPERAATVLERAAAGVELARMIERDRISLEQQARGGLLSDLAAGRSEPADLAARAASLGLPAAPGYLAVVAAPRRYGADGHDPVDRTAALRGLVDQISTVVDRGLVGPLDDQRVAVVLPAGSGRRTAEQTLGRLARALDTERADPAVVLGVGHQVDSLASLAGQLQLAAQVASVAAGLPSVRSRPFYRSSDVRLAGLIALLHDDPRVQAFVESELSHVLRHDAEHGTRHLELLRAYAASGGNKTRLAEATHRSRPAVYKQLAKVSTITGLDVDDPASILSIGVAIMAYDLNRRLHV